MGDIEGATPIRSRITAEAGSQEILSGVYEGVFSGAGYYFDGTSPIVERPEDTMRIAEPVTSSADAALYPGIETDADHYPHSTAEAPVRTAPGSDGHLATILRLPLPELDSGSREPPMFGSTLNEDNVRTFLAQNQAGLDSWFTGALLVSAYREHFSRLKFPGDLRPYAREDHLPEWLEEHLPVLRSLLVPGHTAELEHIRATTSQYESWPFLSNAIRIREIAEASSIGVDRGRIVELAARLIHLEAKQAYDAFLKSHELNQNPA